MKECKKENYEACKMECSFGHGPLCILLDGKNCSHYEEIQELSLKGAKARMMIR